MPNEDDGSSNAEEEYVILITFMVTERMEIPQSFRGYAVGPSAEELEGEAMRWVNAILEKLYEEGRKIRGFGGFKYVERKADIEFPLDLSEFEDIRKCLKLYDEAKRKKIFEELNTYLRLSKDTHFEFEA